MGFKLVLNGCLRGASKGKLDFEQYYKSHNSLFRVKNLFLEHFSFQKSHFFWGG